MEQIIGKLSEIETTAEIITRITALVRPMCCLA